MTDGEKEFENLVRDVRFDDAPDYNHRDKLEQNLLAALNRQSQHKLQALKLWKMMKMIMKSQITKLSSAAAVIIAVVVGSMYFGTSIDGTSAVLAEAIQHVEQVNSAIMHEKRIFTCDGKEVLFLNSDAVRYYSSEYGAREDMYNPEGLLLHQAYWLIQENTRIRVVPPMGQYERTELTEAERGIWCQPGLRAIVELLKAEKLTRLGRSEINGRETEGFEITGSKIVGVLPIQIDSGVARFWVDVETSLPVRYEAELLTSDKLVTSLTDGKPIQIAVTGHELQWNKEIEPNIFEPNIPRDYTVLKSDSNVSFEGQDLQDISKWILENVGEFEYISKSIRGVTIIMRKQFLADIAVFRLQGKSKDVDDFYQKLDIYYGGSPTASGGHYTVIGPRMVRDVFELSTSSDVFALAAQPRLKIRNGHKHLIRINDLGTAVLRAVQKYNEQHVDVSFSFFPNDRESADSTGQIQASIDIPSAKISQEEAVLFRYANPARVISKDGDNAENDAMESAVMLLVQIAEAEK